jgi:hypothetical protein
MRAAVVLVLMVCLAGQAHAQRWTEEKARKGAVVGAISSGLATMNMVTGGVLMDAFLKAPMRVPHVAGLALVAGVAAELMTKGEVDWVRLLVTVGATAGWAALLGPGLVPALTAGMFGNLIVGSLFDSIRVLASKPSASREPSLLGVAASPSGVR